MSFSNYLEELVLNAVFGSVAFTQPAQYVGLYTVTPGEEGGGTEATGGSYARLEIEGATGRLWTAAAAGAISNVAEWAFVTATASWGTLTSFGISDASAAGNLLAYGTFGTSKAIDSGDTAKFAVGDLSITLD